MSSHRTLVVNADDFGFTEDVNDGIVAAHRNGILTATTLMANGAAFHHAVHLARETPSLDIGCHLVLVGGTSVSDPPTPLPRTVTELLHRVALGRIRIYEELRAQIQLILAAGIHPLHLDTHKHTHLLPQVLDAVARLSEDYRIPWVRRPFDFPLSTPPSQVPMSRKVVSRCLSFLRGRFHRVLRKHGCRTTDYFAGFQITGRYGSPELAALLQNLPEGVTEFMCHPGFCREQLRNAPTRLKESREVELQALCDGRTREALAKGEVTLARYRDL